MKDTYKKVFTEQMSKRKLKLQWLQYKLSLLEANSIEHKWDSEEETDAKYEALKELLVERYTYLKNSGLLNAEIADTEMQKYL